MYFPLTQYLGYATARRALLCTLVDPSLRGVILSGPVGSGKSALVRSFGAFVREHVDPLTPFVQTPLGVSEDRLLGGIDIDASLATGERLRQSGLIAQADGGFLFVDDLPLLDELAATSIVHALESESVVCEREGISTKEVSRFVLLATMVPAERDLAIGVADRVAFLIGHEKRLATDAVQLLIGRIERFNASPQEFYAEHIEAEQELAARVAAARMLYSLTEVTRGVLLTIAGHAQRLNITGNRAEVFAAKAARSHAALRGAREIEEEDINFAVASVLNPRQENVPDDERPSENEGKGAGEQQSSGSDASPQPSQADAQGESEGESAEGAEGGSGSASAMSEQIFDAANFNGPLVDLADFFRSERGATTGRHGVLTHWQRGRHARSLQAPAQGRRIAVAATLRAASSHQKSRRLEGEQRVIVRNEDLRVKKFTDRSGTLFIFCVDASGSMAMNRMREAKGAVTRLLQDAYVNRDNVALIAFRGDAAEVLLPPTASIQRAKRSLDVLPTGGGTPLASALLKAYAMVAQERRRKHRQSLVVLLTDGRANVPMTENAAGMIMELRRQHVRRELESVSESFRRDGVRSLVIDTKQSFGQASEAVRLATMLGGEYYFLPMIDAQGIADVVRGIAER